MTVTINGYTGVNSPLVSEFISVEATKQVSFALSTILDISQFQGIFNKALSRFDGEITIEVFETVPDVSSGIIQGFNPRDFPFSHADTANGKIYLYLDQINSVQYRGLDGNYHNISLQSVIAHEFAHLAFDGWVSWIATFFGISDTEARATSWVNDFVRSQFGDPQRGDYSDVILSENPIGFDISSPNYSVYDFLQNSSLFDPSQIPSQFASNFFGFGYKLENGSYVERTANELTDQCFLAGTMIDMADGSQKPIEDIRPEDQVMAFDETGKKVAGRVTRTMTNESKIILDFHGTFVTPGHVYYCAGGKFEGGFAPIIDILRDDGVVQHEDNTLIRAATGCVVGSELDAEIWVLGIEADANGVYHEKIRKKLRLGTRFVVQGGKSVSIAEDLHSIGMRACADGFVEHVITGKRMLYQWPVAGEMPPNPEDYVLQRSGTTLEDIYRAGEWEGQRPQMPPPMIRDGGEVTPVSERTLMAMPRNVPMAMREGTPADSAPKLNRKARKALEAKRRKAAKHTRGNATLH